MTPRVKIRYYGGLSNKPLSSRCSSCSKGRSNSKVRILRERIQFRSDLSKTGIRTATFDVGRDYYVTEFEANELLKLHTTSMTGQVQPKFKVISEANDNAAGR